MNKLIRFFTVAIVLLGLTATAHAQLTFTLDGAQNKAKTGVSTFLAAGTYSVESSGNFSFIPKGATGDTAIDLVYQYRTDGVANTPIYVPNNVMVDFNGTTSALTTYTGFIPYRFDQLYDYSFVAPADGTYHFHSDSIPQDSFSGGDVNFVQKGFTPGQTAPVPEASSAIGLGILLSLCALTLVCIRKRARCQ